ncbi:MAG TPA: hypothetical protein VFS26_00860, partial [Solirubrobacterales bacterium]|nr:hypothetical protein [Solirubrobacterales bacterium]
MDGAANVRSTLPVNYAAAMIDPADALRQKVARALAEDLGTGDVTAEATVPAQARARARIVQKQPGVVYGLEVVAETM